MRLNKIPSFPFYVALIPLFYVWHKMNEYFGLVEWRYGLNFLFKVLLAGLFVLLIGKLLFKKWVNAGVYTAFCLIAFIHWGLFHDALKSLPIPEFFSSYKFLIGLLFISLLIFAIYLSRKRTNLVRFSRYLNVLYTVLLFIELIKTIGALPGNNQYSYLQSMQKKTPHYKDLNLNMTHAPDIFWIVLDEYASTKSLNQHLNFDNKEIDSLLVANGFFIVQDSRSNYNLTPYSIASELDMNFLVSSQQRESLEVIDMLKARNAASHAQFPKILHRNGYTIKNLGLIDIFKSEAPYGQLFEDMDQGIFENETFLKRFYDQIWWNFRDYWPFGPDSLEIRETKLKSLRINQKNYSALLEEIQTGSSKPRFVYSHILMPHGEYLVDRFGNERIPLPYEYLLDISDSLYIDQTIFVNTWIRSIVAKVNQDTGRPKVVIIQGDHGRRTQTPSSKIPILTDEKSFQNLNAIYFSDNDYSKVYNNLSSVNTFRIVLNKYFATNLSLLYDLSIPVLKTDE